MLSRIRMLALNGVLLLALGGSYWGRRIEGAVTPPGNFLQALRLPFRGWTVREFSLTPVEQEALEPDAVLVRRYTAPTGESAELAIIAGHRKKTVHTPGFCMLGDGWQLLSQREAVIPLPAGNGDAIPATRALMTKDGHQIVVSYFFTDGDYSTSSLVRFQAVQLLKRFRSQVPLGALVRIIVSVEPGRPDHLTDPFAEETLLPVLEALKRQRLQIN